MLDQTNTPDVVVIEDNEDDARLTTMALRRIQPKPAVVVINDGKEAMDRLTGDGALHPKVILLDLKLPKVHGLDILAALKENVDSKDIPVLILTSSDHPIDVDRSRAIGCTEYICKPVDWERYIDVVCSSTSRYL